MDMAEMLNKLMSDPSAMAAAAEMAGKLLNNNAPTAAAAAPDNTYKAPPESLQTVQSTARSQQSDNTVADMLSSALSDPSFMEKLPQLTSVMAPLLQSASGGAGTNDRPTSSPPPPIRYKAEKSEQEKRNALLLALKPYLSPERAEAVDQIIRLTELITLFSLFK